jgi:triacylglycerol lipase
MRFKSPLTFIFCFLCLANSAEAYECVILLHALGRTSNSMSSMAAYLTKANYIVVNHGYPTTRKSIQALADENVGWMVNQCQQFNPTKINFVTHSIGGVVLRAYLQNNKIPNMGRIVMLAPPNHGSQLADLLKHNILFQVIAGPAGQELTTVRSSVPNALNPPEKYQIGVIAGNFSLNPLMKYIFHGENDGKVAVASTKIKGMKDFIVLPVSHTFMTKNTLVMKEVGHFLQKGMFDKTLIKAT